MINPISRKEYGKAYETGRNQTVSFLISRGLNEDEAREKAQAAWAKGWERRYQMKDKKKALAWVNTIALNLYRSSYIRESRYERMREFPVQPHISTAAFDLRNKIEECRKKDNEILKLRYFMGFGIKDLAHRYGCTETAVRVKLLRARRNLKGKFT